MITILRPTDGDVVDLIVADHRLFEDLNPARLEATPATRAEVGMRFAQERTRLLDAARVDEQSLRHIIEHGSPGPLPA